ncbi:hypothetical protein [Crocinitomix algicola]|uniref:hypothetical protein n=1 Tax=Crocinitomix algicola TaxID=1740263 RepID=UPI000872D8CF|nr:hypothetical protein [Crocinitomix algicola]
MTNKFNFHHYKLFTFSILLSFAFISCKKNKAGKELDQELYEMAQETSGFTWYKNSDALLEKSAGSGHPMPYLRTRYNATAANFLDEEGKVIPGTIFSEGSLIVKELYDDPETISRYALFYKDSDNEYSDELGWVYGYVEANGDVASPSKNKGGSCIDCHSQSGNIDRTLMNNFYP